MLLCKQAALWPVGMLCIDRKCSAPLGCISADYLAKSISEALSVTAKRSKMVNMMTFMATDLKVTPAGLSGEQILKGDHARDKQHAWLRVAGWRGGAR